MNPEAVSSLHGLLSRLADGDRAACRPAFELLWPIVRRFTGRALAGANEADDAAQDVLIKVFEQAVHFDVSRSALPWVLSIAAYECKTYRQRARRSKLIVGDQPDVASVAGDPEQSAIARDLEAAVREAVQGLSTKDQITLRTVLDEQRTDPLSAAVRKQLSRALLRLRILWRSRHGLD